MTDRNTLLAIVLSMLVLVGWQYFIGMPQLERQRQLAQQQTSQPQDQTSPLPSPTSTGVPAAQTLPTEPTRPAPRVGFETPRMNGSISLKGARIDEVFLNKYRETVQSGSPAIQLLAPAGSAQPFYAEFGWVPAAGSMIALPTSETLWTQEGHGLLTSATPLILTWDNGSGLIFRRKISVDEQYLFSIEDSVQNSSSQPVTLHPYGLISRHGRPHVMGYYILHEGLLGVFGDQGLQEYTYKKIEDAGQAMSWTAVNGWLGITDKYWAAALLPDPAAKVQGRFSTAQGPLVRTYQTDYMLDAVTIPAGGAGTATGRLFAGAKEVAVIDHYEKTLGLNRFELIIDWGWFYFITKPMFHALDYFYRLVGNFGVSILIVTVLLKALFFPLATKSYAAMARMKILQPKMAEIKERFEDDKLKQQQALMELYKQEKINPVAGCWPMLLQVPVFFALYKVLFVTIEMRHQPFFGWIKDLSAPDPTSLFNLFGLIPWAPPSMLMLGAWPIMMGITMWVQMQMNPSPPDPTQKLIFTWMPLVFTFMLAAFPAGLVIYWTWNNLLSIIQQMVIMKRNGAKIELFDNIKGLFARTPS